MTDRDQVRLSEDKARRLLERASELEARRGSEVLVADLRKAAQEAGITTGAFDQALAELQSASVAVAPPPQRRWLMRILPAALILAFLVYFLGRTVIVAP
jgi:hypothetical protein